MSKMMRLNSSHPLSKKLDELAAKADELGLRLGCNRGGVWTVTDTATSQEVMVIDIEVNPLDIFRDPGVHEFPPTTEYKLVYEKEEA